MTDDHQDILAKLRADFDQALVATRELAKLSAVYREELVEQGLDDETATVLTAAYTSAIVQRPSD